MDAHETMMNARGKNARETKGQKKKGKQQQKKSYSGRRVHPVFQIVRVREGVAKPLGAKRDKKKKGIVMSSR